MQITFLGHAGFFVESGGEAILCDPWFSPFGAYAASWFPFPANDSIDLPRLERATHFYISHWHEDHLDEWFLRARSERFKREVMVIIPKFEYPRLRDVIAQCGYANVLEIEDEYLTEKGTRIYIQRDENPLYSDSSIVIGDGRAVFVNSNDCKLTIGQEEEIVRRFGAVTVYAAQYSGATFHPTCYQYSSEKKIEMSLSRREAKFQRIVDSVQRLKAKAYIPSAGPACFLDEELFHLNLNPETVFSTSSDLYDWLRQNVQRQWAFVELNPGETMKADAISEHCVNSKYETNNYIRNYALKKREAVAERIAEFDTSIQDVMSEAKHHFQAKLEDVSALAKKANVVLEVRIGNESFFVDTFDGSISNSFPLLFGKQFYRIELSEFWMRAILAKKIRWEDFILSFRFKIVRKPDVYNEALIAFLQLDTAEEREDYVRHLELLSSRERERIIREHEGCTFEYDRFCPHNLEDLTNAKIDNGMLTCPRHFWRFSMEDGRGLNNPGGINLVRKEMDGCS